MSKNLKINISSEGKIGRIDIIGQINEWNRNNATDLRERCTELKDSGVTSCHVYLMTIGGDCFQANEIVNIFTDTFGSYTGEGGAIVASAGTYIAVCASSFAMAKNGQFMIHKPQGWSNGNETEIENYLKLLQNMTKTYYDAYTAKLKKPESEFKKKWESGDFWLTAEEAKDWGFSSEIKEPVKVDDETGSMLQSRNINSEIFAKLINDNKDMDLRATAIALGLPGTATEEQVNAKIAENANAATELASLKAEQVKREKEERSAKIKGELDKAEKEHRISATERAKWESAFGKDFEGTKALLDGIEPVKKLSGDLSAGTGKTVVHNGKTFEQLQDEDPEILAELQDSDPEKYDALFAAYKKKNKVN